MAFEIENHFHDVLILGSGGSGLTAAILAARKNLNVGLVSKSHPLKSHTVAAQGGINASLGNITPDKWQWHAYDTIKAAHWIADQDSVEEMCKKAPEAIKLLSSLGVEFDKTSEGKINQKIYGGQSTDFGKGGFAHRACFSKDRTGHTIMHSLYNEAKNLNIKFYNYNFALDLLVENNSCYGVVCWEIENGRINIIHAKNTIIATGGYSQIYETSTSAAVCTGDGSGLAARAGIGLQDMEFVQFHPTALYKVGVLITEAARSAGGILLNKKNERFIEKYAPNFKELAPRDIVARAIAAEIALASGGKKNNYLYLDLRHLTSEEIKTNLPTVFENCKEFIGIDPSSDLIPIAPAAHYTMGGIPTNANCRVVNIIQGQEILVNSLYTIGEAACISVHGAGRLGCNSLLDLIVFAEKAIESITPDSHPLSSKNYLADPIIENFKALFSKPSLKTGKITAELKNIMSKNVGIFRTGSSLKTALDQVIKIEKAYHAGGVSEQSLCWNLELQHYLELGNLIINAKYTARSALWRKESRGAHWRADYPGQSNEYIIHTLCFKDHIKTREIRYSKENVDFYQSATRNY